MNDISLHRDGIGLNPSVSCVKTMRHARVMGQDVLVSDSGNPLTMDQLLDAPDGATAMVDVTGLPEDMLGQSGTLHVAPFIGPVVDEIDPTFLSDDGFWAALAAGDASLARVSVGWGAPIGAAMRAAAVRSASGVAHSARAARVATMRNTLVRGGTFVGAKLPWKAIGYAGASVWVLGEVTKLAGPQCRMDVRSISPDMQVLTTPKCEVCVISGGKCVERFQSPSGPIGELSNLVLIGGLAVGAVLLITLLK